MDIVPALTKAAASKPLDSELTAKIRWSLIQRLRKQMSELNSNFFDEVDDFLFAIGQQGPLADDGINLKAMREIRSKKALFEESFLCIVLQEIKSSSGINEIASGQSSRQARVQAIAAQSGQDMLYEKAEIDLALNAMKRKSRKRYLPHIKQIESLAKKHCISLEKHAVDGDALLGVTLTAFAESQAAFVLPMDIRLVFMKLFEQHFLLKMEKFFLDVIGVLNNVNDHDFVEKLYTSSSADQKSDSKKPNRISKPDPILKQVSTNEAYTARPKDSGQVALAVNEFIISSCAKRSAPLFVERMIKGKWRGVLFLIGLNRGVSSVEWQEAMHTVSLLVACTNKQSPLGALEKSSLFAQIQQGFSLAQLDKEEQDQFLEELEHHLAGDNDSEDGKVKAENANAPESMISPVGSKVLSRDDLNEISKLICGAQSDGGSIGEDEQIQNHLLQVDGLKNDSIIEYFLGGVFVECKIRKSTVKPQNFSLINSDAKISVSRSRLGLALSLRDGDIRLPQVANAEEQPRQITVIEHRSPSVPIH